MKLDVNFSKERMSNEFINVLAWMEWCSNVGHSSTFTVNIDGDGAAAMKVNFEDEELQNKYNELRHSMKDINYPLYPRCIDDIDIRFSID